MSDNEKQFESDIEKELISEAGGWIRYSDKAYTTEEAKKRAIDIDTLVSFVQETQKTMWIRFEKTCNGNAKEQFYKIFEDAVQMFGIVYVLQHGFKHRGMEFKVVYFKPESTMNQLSVERYKKNICHCIRQWHYSTKNNNSIDMMLAVNGIPVIALELKDQLTGQNIDNAMAQWMKDRDEREPALKFNHRVVAFFAVDLYEVSMTTRLKGDATYFLPFNQGSNGPGVDGGAGNRRREEETYPTAYLWKGVLQKDSLLDILQKFVSFQIEEVEEDDENGKTHKTKKEKIIFPRYHQLDVVRELIADVSKYGSGKNYLIQHSAGSGKSNSIAWTAYRLASLHDDKDQAIFSSVIVITDRKVLDTQLQNTIDGFDHTLGSVVLIDDKKSSKDLLKAISDGKKLIVSTLQKFPVIYDLVGDTTGKNYAIIVDEAHSSQTGQSALKLKMALADVSDALEEYAELEEKAIEEVDHKNDMFMQELVSAGRHKNLSFFAFTATPRDKTLELFGIPDPSNPKGYRPFHVYSMHQAIEEGFIMDVLENYTTIKTCSKVIRKNEEENPEVPSTLAAKAIRQYVQQNEVNIIKKSEIIVEKFLEVTKPAINGKGKMMVVTSSRLAAVRYCQTVRKYIEEKGYKDILVMVAFSGSVKDPDDKESPEYTESNMNFDKDGKRVLESQTKTVFHKQGQILIVAEKYQTGFDEPLLHTMIVDKRLRDVKAVQTLSRLNRICEGKIDTFVLDFANNAEDIQKAFQGFYTETLLEEEINVDLIYKKQMELRHYKIYGDDDVNAVAEIYRDPANHKRDTGYVQAKISNALVDTARAYNQLAPESKKKFRIDARSFVKWYNYISQIIRLYDEDLHEEYIFCFYLIRLLPKDGTKDWDLGNSVQLEYYKLQQTFKGRIELKADTKGSYEPVTIKNMNPKEQKMKTLDEVLDAVNEALRGDFTDADKVVFRNLWDMLIHSEQLKRSAIQDGKQMFINNIFPKKFDEVTMEAYLSHQDVYQSLFEHSGSNDDKYAIFMAKLAAALFDEFTKS